MKSEHKDHGDTSRRSSVAPWLLVSLLAILVCCVLLTAASYSGSGFYATGWRLSRHLEEQTHDEKRQAQQYNHSDAFFPGQPWFDEDRRLIQAHGGGVLFNAGRYYWFGEHKGGKTYQRSTQAYSPPRVDVIGISCYSSLDLLHWRNEGLVLQGGTHPDRSPENVLERPKVIYHRKSGTFVMWLHVDTEDYEWARIGYAISHSVTGPYTYVRSWRPHNQQARDFTVFQDDDDKAYLAYSSEDNAVMHMARLHDDFQGVKAQYKRILVHQKREAPAIFKYKDYYLLLTSGCTAWAPNRAALYFAREMMGAWQPLGNPFAGGSELERAYTFYSQPTAVIKVQHLAGRYVVMTDNWDTDELGASRYSWYPMWIEELTNDKQLVALQHWAQDLVSKSDESNWQGSYMTALPGPIHAVVPGSDSWQPQILERPLNWTLKQQHWQELRTFPERKAGPFDLSQDALYGQRLKPMYQS